MKKRDEVDNAMVAATQLANDGDFEAALELIERTKENAPSDPRVLRTLAGTLFRAQKYEEGVRAAQHATQVTPDSEISSLSLFHCLWNLDRQEEAKAEAARFLSVSSSQEYAMLLTEMDGRLTGRAMQLSTCSMKKRREHTT